MKRFPEQGKGIVKKVSKTSWTISTHRQTNATEVENSDIQYFKIEVDTERVHNIQTVSNPNQIENDYEVSSQRVGFNQDLIIFRTVLRKNKLRQTVV